MQSPAQTTAKIVSGVTSPFLVIFVAATLVILHVSASFALHWLPFVACVIGAPLVLVAAGVRAGRITDFHVEVKEQRGLPFAAGTLGSLLLLAVYWALQAPLALIALAADLVLNGILFFFVSKHWKASVHSAAWAGSCVILGILVSPKWLWGLLGLPLIAWARVLRGKHNVPQAMAAALATGAATAGILALFGLTSL